MPLRVGILSSAHVHTGGYVACLQAHPGAEIVGLWDDQTERGETYAQQTGLTFTGYLDDLLAAVDAVVICSENVHHVGLTEKAAAAGCHVLCEKPLATSLEDADRMVAACEKAGVVLMTAFPCRFTPGWVQLKQKVADGAIGKIKAICATNRGRCPGGWFIDPSLSGGGAMIDHVVHVADLLRDLLGEDPVRVQAQTGNNVYGQTWDDTAMLTIEFPSGVFATLDSSWSRPRDYHTWGDVTLNVVGENGVIELNMFGGHVRKMHGQVTSYGYGSNADQGMVDEFVAAIAEKRSPSVTGHDGRQAALVALAGYRSVTVKQPVPFLPA